MADYDLVAFGETMIRLSTPLGQRLETSTALDIGIGGAESNVAIALARLGRRVAWGSVLPRNPFGLRIAAELRRHQVDDRQITWTDQGRVGVYYLDSGAPPRPTHVIYDRAASSIALCDPDEIDTSLATRARLLHLTGITPALSASCAEITRRFAERAQEASVPLSFDVNYRARLWTPQQAAATLEPLCASATVLFCGRNDARTLWGIVGDNEAILAELARRFGAATTVLTLGDEGALVRTESGDVLHDSAPAVQVVDKVGAGDAFAAGFLHGYLDGDIPRALRLGVALASLKMTIHGDLALITAHELEDWSGITTHTVLR
ncbi:MAG TPA: sugar kinase [Nitrolancea sp.]|nr:sugar kinase [Nitrolancea sp.]